jgi:hypothetical protein
MKNKAGRSAIESLIIGSRCLVIELIMEFREFCHIFYTHRRQFFGVAFAFLVLSVVVYRFQPIGYEAGLTLNVARSGMRETSDFTYDQFYRLQADERFADTVVRWLGEPSVRETIRSRAEANDSSIESLSAKRLSSQVIHVRYTGRQKSDFGRMADVIPEVLNEASNRINEASQDPDWFMLVSDEPVIRDTRWSLGVLLGFGTFFGVFFAFWTVLLSWYFRDGTRDKS